MLESGQDDGRPAALVPVPHPVQPKVPPEGTLVLRPLLCEKVQSSRRLPGAPLQEPAAEHKEHPRCHLVVNSRYAQAYQLALLPWKRPVCEGAEDLEP